MRVLELHDILGRTGAPPELVAAVRERGLELDEAWKRCARGDHRMWLAACGGASIEALVEAAAAAVLVVCERYDRASDPVARTVELAVSGAIDADDASIAACDAIAGGALGTYRQATYPGLGHAARAAALVVRAAQGLREGEARREAARLLRARQTAAILGAGTHITLPADPGPARLHPVLAAHDPAQGAFVFAVAAAAEALVECAAATQAEGIDSERELDEAVRSVIELGELPR